MACTDTRFEEIQRLLTHIKADEGVGKVLHEYGVDELEDILVLKHGDLIDAGMTLVQVHQISQIAYNASEADHSRVAFKERAQDELSPEQPETRDGHGHKLRFNDEDIQRALHHSGDDDEAQEALKEYRVTSLEEILELKMSNLIKANMIIMQIHLLMQTALQYLDMQLKKEPDGIEAGAWK